jgi:MYXO-CTERM domain-containing protein
MRRGQQAAGTEGRHRTVRPLDRLMAYTCAVLCALLLWISLASPAGDWHKPAGLLVGGVGLAALAVVILRRRRW